ncbi:hypothetical protein RFI_30268 [Reticulomyxa filosa]|uniref:Uncharacterized protein n=1 Tax=Reticulomyxa filosa TaxID=46433 RepID=X6LZR6_RETFI|nr:hypothetical protein RFI_30268 [Reticulomyxa filosa]|eukprot:ETO07124.1 hypothetical protein RFI_30268 [Reticulomyxa filosa]
MLEHPDDIGVQLQGLKLLAALAQHNNTSIIDTLCQHITLETDLKAIQGNVKNPAMMGAFADLINGLLKDEKKGPQVAQALQAEGIPEFLQKGLEHHKMNMDVAHKISQASKTIDQYLYKPNIGKMTGDLKQFGTMAMAQLANMDPEQLMKIMGYVKQLIKQDTVAIVMDTMQKNTDRRSLIQMSVVVLANLSSHEKGLKLFFEMSNYNN